MITKNQIIVTGGCGFIGSHLVDELLRCNNHVIVIDNLSSGYIKNLDIKNDNLKFLKNDIQDIYKFKQIFENSDCLFHIAANASVPLSVKNLRLEFNSNIRGTFEVLNLAKETGIKKVFFASSAAVYGGPEYLPIDEKHILNPFSPYGVSKLYGEKLGFALKEIFGLNFVVGRFFNSYGPRCRRYVIHDIFLKALRNSNEIELLGDGYQTRDYIYISDTVQSIMLIMAKGSGCYNIASGEPIAINSLARKIIKILKIDCKINFNLPTWKGDIKHLESDNKKLMKLGFKPQISLDQGLQLFYHWLREESN